MPQYRLSDVTCPAIVQERSTAVHGTGQAYPPKRLCAPVAPAGSKIWPVVCQCLAHIVQQQVGVGVEGLIREGRQRLELLTGLHFRHMADGTSRLLEHGCSALHSRIAEV